MTRTCNTCNLHLDIAKFNKTGDGKHRNRICRACQHKKNLLNPRYRMSRMLSMAKLRCENPDNRSYSRYGGRGIKFMIDREEFYAKFEKRVKLYIDAGEVPSIDRIDPDGHYEIGNIQIIPQVDNTNEMRTRLRDQYKQKRILKEQALTKQCQVCSKHICTQEYYIKKRYKDGTIVRYNICPSCK